MPHLTREIQYRYGIKSSVPIQSDQKLYLSSDNRRSKLLQRAFPLLLWIRLSIVIGCTSENVLELGKYNSKKEKKKCYVLVIAYIRVKIQFLYHYVWLVVWQTSRVRQSDQSTDESKVWHFNDVVYVTMNTYSVLHRIEWTNRRF